MSNESSIASLEISFDVLPFRDIQHGSCELKLPFEVVNFRILELGHFTQPVVLKVFFNLHIQQGCIPFLSIQYQDVGKKKLYLRHLTW